MFAFLVGGGAITTALRRLRGLVHWAIACATARVERVFISSIQAKLDMTCSKCVVLVVVVVGVVVAGGGGGGGGGGGAFILEHMRKTQLFLNLRC